MINSYSRAFKSLLYREFKEADATFKVDYDTARNPLRILQIRRTLVWLRSRGINIVRARVYRTRKGWHLRLWGSPVPGRGRIGPWTVLRTQSMLGDDPIRQKFNECRVRRHEDGWNVLWNEKWRNGRLISQETRDHQQEKRVNQEIERCRKM